MCPPALLCYQSHMIRLFVFFGCIRRVWLPFHRNIVQQNPQIMSSINKPLTSQKEVFYNPQKNYTQVIKHFVSACQYIHSLTLLQQFPSLTFLMRRLCHYIYSSNFKQFLLLGVTLVRSQKNVEQQIALHIEQCVQLPVPSHQLKVSHKCLLLPSCPHEVFRYWLNCIVDTVNS